MKHVYKLVTTIFLICSLTGCYDREQVSFCDYFNRLESQIWQNPADALDSLAIYNPEKLDLTEKMHWYLLSELANSRLNDSGSPDSVMTKVIDFYKQQGLKSYAARAYYVQGVEHFLKSRSYEAMRSLKEAENRMAYLPDSLPYKCMIYFLEGKLFETEYLFHIANDYYQKALDNAIVIDDRYRMACCYYNIARTRSEFNDSVSHQYYIDALDIAKELNDSLFYYEILIQEEVHNTTIGSANLYLYAKNLTDNYHDSFYAHYVVEYLQNQYRIDEAAYYLGIFSSDSVNSAWSKERFHYLQSRQDNLSGLSAQAFHKMEKLYLDQMEQIYRDGKAKTYTISRMYDVEQEQNKNLKLTIDKQHLWLVIGFILSVLIISTLIATYILQVHKERERAHLQELEIQKLHAREAEAESRKEIDRLNMELEVKRKVLLSSLKTRIELSQKMAQNPEDIELQISNPSKPLKEWMAENVFINGQNKDKLLVEFKYIYGNLLKNLKRKYSNLSDKDLLFIALSVLGLDVNEIGYILGTTDRTTWNRRQQIKNRIGDPKLDFDKWIQSLRKKS